MSNLILPLEATKLSGGWSQVQWVQACQSTGSSRNKFRKILVRPKKHPPVWQVPFSSVVNLLKAKSYQNYTVHQLKLKSRFSFCERIVMETTDDRFFSFEDFMTGSFEFSFSYLWFCKAYQSTWNGKMFRGLSSYLKWNSFWHARQDELTASELCVR